MQFPVPASLRLATALPTSSSLLASRETCGHLDAQAKEHPVDQHRQSTYTVTSDGPARDLTSDNNQESGDPVARSQGQ